jgi:hypothetical protein
VATNGFLKLSIWLQDPERGKIRRRGATTRSSAVPQ